MIKTLITAIFLSQVPIHDAKVNYDYTKYAAIPTKYSNTYYIRNTRDVPVVVAEDPWTTPSAQVPYYWLWNNGLNQTAMQYIAILSMMQQELDEVDQSILNQELLRLKKRIEEKALRRNIPYP